MSFRKCRKSESKVGCQSILIILPGEADVTATFKNHEPGPVVLENSVVRAWALTGWKRLWNRSRKFLSAGVMSSSPFTSTNTVVSSASFHLRSGEYSTVTVGCDFLGVTFFNSVLNVKPVTDEIRHLVRPLLRLILNGESAGACGLQQTDRDI